MIGNTATRRPRRVSEAGILLATLSVTLCLGPSIVAAPATPKVETRQPRNIYELVYAFEHTFMRVLEGKELKLYRTHSPEELREVDPELYQRISDDVKAWTTLWIHYINTTLVPIPEKRLHAAQQAAEQVDAILRPYFEARQWPYKPMHAIFLPPQVFLDERHRADITSGMFIPYYPDAFFVSVDWPVPLELVLVHETLHYNAVGRYGSPLAEGITETATRHIVLKHALLTPRAIQRVDTYPLERKGIDVILGEIEKRTGKDRDEAVDLFLGAYLTGVQGPMDEVFGSATWDRVTGLAHSPGGWQPHRIREALETD